MAGPDLLTQHTILAPRWLTLPSKDMLHPGPSLQKGLLELEKLLYP